MHLLLFLICVSNGVLAQNRQKGSYTVYLNNPNGSIKADVVYENKKISTKEDLTYFWYTSNKIIETKGGYDGRILDGAYTVFYLSDNLKEKGFFKNGVKDREWKSWYENGRVKEITNWKNGLKHGLYKKFDSRGVILIEATNKNGKLNGYEILYESEKIISKKKYSDGKELLPKPKNEKKETVDSTETKRKFNFFKKKETSKKDNVSPENKREKNKESKIKKKKEAKSKNLKPEPDKSKKVSFANKLKNIFKKKEKKSEHEIAKSKK